MERKGHFYLLLFMGALLNRENLQRLISTHFIDVATLFPTTKAHKRTQSVE